MEFDHDDNDHRCKADAVPGHATCYLHSKYVLGLCAPDYDYFDGADAQSIKRISVFGETIWERGVGV